MAARLQGNYCSGEQDMPVPFYRLPRQLMVDERYKWLSADAKLLYSLLLDRLCLSGRNGWRDKEGRTFVYFPIDEVQTVLNCGRCKAIKLLAELDNHHGVGLIERVRQGMGKADRIYILRVFPCAAHEKGGDSKKSENQTSRSLKIRPQEVLKSDRKYTKEKYTEKTYTEKNKREGLVNSTVKWGSNTPPDACRREIMNRLDCETLADAYGRENVLTAINLIADVLCKAQGYLRIGQESVSAEAVKERFQALKTQHLAYVFECLQMSDVQAVSVRGYMFVMLYNAPEIVKQYQEAGQNVTVGQEGPS